MPHEDIRGADRRRDASQSSHNGIAPRHTPGLSSNQRTLRSSAAYRKTPRTQSPPASVISVPIEVARFWKNRRHDVVVVQLKEFEGRVLIDLRQFFTSAEGKLLPTKRGLALSILKLPELAAAVTKALSIARELKLIAGAAP